MHRSARQIPALPARPLLGNIAEFRRGRVRLIERVREECGGVGAFHLGPRRVVVVSDLAAAHTILVERAADFEKGPTVRRFLRPLFGEGLISAANATHRTRRRLLQPAFHPARLAHHAADIVADTRAATRGLTDGATIEVADFTTALALRVIGRALLGVNLTAEEPLLRATLSLLQAHATESMRSLVPWPLWVPTPRNLRVRRGLSALDARIAAWISHERASPRGRHLLAELVALRDDDGAPLSDREVRDESVTLLVAGHETVAHALAWTLYLLLMNDGAYAALRREVRAVLGDRPATHEDLPALASCTRAFKEAMRLYPPVHALGRVATCAVPLGDYALHAGDVVIVSTYLIHRRADLHTEPLAFRPERFRAEAEARLPRLAYLPFGAGPRACIGGSFALMEGSLILATLAQHLSLTRAFDGPIEPEMFVTLRPRSAITARATQG